MFRNNLKSAFRTLVRRKGQTLINCFGLADLFSREFLVLVGLAFCIAAPIAWYFMSRWLEGYEYHFQLNPWIFLFGGTLATLIAMGTVSYQSIKVAIANPVKSLRNE
jgi:ABC-type antimicrobial peptide transport system permease subunit